MNSWAFFVGKLMTLQDAVYSTRPALIMGVLNVTPDSFSDGGRYNQLDQLKSRIEQLHLEGADIIDIGGESTRPGAPTLSVQQELDRVLPALEMAKELSDCWVSIDTCKTDVMRSCLELGVDMINDVTALRATGAVDVCAPSSVMLCLMHMQGNPQTMQQAPAYSDVVQEVSGFLQERVQACQQAGIDKTRLVLDPGFGFGKNLAHNIELFKNLKKMSFDGLALLIGVSRKSMLGEILNLPVDQRLQASVTAAVLAVQQGARIVRVHDVLQTKQALTIANVLQVDGV